MPENLQKILSSVLNQKYIWAKLFWQMIHANLGLVAMTTHMLCLQLSFVQVSNFLQIYFQQFSLWLVII